MAIKMAAIFRDIYLNVSAMMKDDTKQPPTGRQNYIRQVSTALLLLVLVFGVKLSKIDKDKLDAAQKASGQVSQKMIANFRQMALKILKKISTKPFFEGYQQSSRDRHVTELAEELVAKLMEKAKQKGLPLYNQLDQNDEFIILFNKTLLQKKEKLKQCNSEKQRLYEELDQKNKELQHQCAAENKRLREELEAELAKAEEEAKKEGNNAKLAKAELAKAKEEAEKRLQTEVTKRIQAEVAKRIQAEESKRLQAENLKVLRALDQKNEELEIEQRNKKKVRANNITNLKNIQRMLQTEKAHNFD
jgi:hypothetical protein